MTYDSNPLEFGGFAESARNLTRVSRIADEREVSRLLADHSLASQQPERE